MRATPSRILASASAAVIFGITLVFAERPAPSKSGAAENGVVAAEVPANSRRPAWTPFLWRIQIDGGKPSYAFGSIHIPSRDLIKLPPVVDAAFKSADAVFCEIPFDAGSMKKIMAAMSDAPKPLAAVLPPDLYERSEQALKKIIPTFNLKALDNLEPWTLAMLLLLFEEQLKAQGTPAFDMWIFHKATTEGKQTDGIETAEEQLEAIRFPESEQIELLRATLDEMDSVAEIGQSVAGQLMSVYRTGDLAALDARARESMARYSPGLRKRFEEKLLTERNRRMADRIAAMIRAEPEKSRFIVLGALHYVGETSVVALLGKAGLKVERVATESSSPAPANR